MESMIVVASHTYQNGLQAQTDLSTHTLLSKTLLLPLVDDFPIPLHPRPLSPTYAEGHEMVALLHMKENAIVFGSQTHMIHCLQLTFSSLL